MPKTIKNNFAGGELSSDLEGRTDLAKYSTGAQLLSNFFVTRFGGVSNRPGTEYIGKSLRGSDDTAREARLLPFEFSVTQAYVLEFTDNIMRVMKDGAVVLISRVSATYKWTASSFGSDEWYLEASGGGDPFLTGIGAKECWEDGTQMTEGTVGSLAAGEWAFADNDTLGYTTVYVRLTATGDPDLQTAGWVQTDYQLYTGIGEAILPKMTFAQSADTLFLAEEGLQPSYITRTLDNAWTITAMSFAPSPATPLDFYSALTAFVASDRQCLYRVSNIDSQGRESLASDVITVDIDLNWPTAGRVDLYWNNVTDGLESGPVFKWTQIGATSEYYLELATTGDPSIALPSTVWEDKVEMVYGTGIGSLSAGKWFYGDGGGGFNTIIVYIAAGADPDTKAVGYITYSVSTDYQWRVYKNYRGDWGWLGDVDKPWFLDDNIEPDVAVAPKDNEDPFNTGDPDDYPAVVAIYQQRLFYARSANNPQRVWASALNDLNNYAISKPLSSDDRFIVTLVSGGRVDDVKHLLPLRKDLLVLTSGSEWSLGSGSNSDALSPYSVAFSSEGYEGASATIPPIGISNRALFIQRDNQQLRALGYNLDDGGYPSAQLNLLAQHLFEDDTVVDWCYQQHPYNLIWMVMSDGDMVGMTYLPDQELIAFTRHSTDGDVKACASITNDTVDDVYFIVERTIGGTKTSYIEKLSSRAFGTDVREAKFLDSALTYDPQLTITDVAPTATEVTVTTSTAHGYSNGDFVWLQDVTGITSTEALADYNVFNQKYYKVANASGSTFELQSGSLTVSRRNSSYKWTASGSGTSEYYLELAAGGDPNIPDQSSVLENELIMAVGTAGSLVAGEWDYADNDTLGYSTIYVRLSDSTDPDSQAVGYVKSIGSVKLTTTHFTGTYVEGGSVWKCTKSVSGLDHLEGETVKVLADGQAIGDFVVTSGSITLGTEDPGYGLVHVGLPYNCDMQTLRFELATGADTVQYTKKNIKKMIMRFKRSSGGYAGPDTANLSTIKWRQNEYWQQPNNLKTEDVEHKIASTWDREGRVYFRQSDPLPTTILALIMEYNLGDI